MNRPDHRASPAANAGRRHGASKRSGLGGTLLGMFVGVALGLALAAAVAYYLMKAGNPYQSTAPARETPREPAKDPARPGRTETGAAEKPRFDFYKILPGVEEAKVQPKSADRGAADKASTDRGAADKASTDRAAAGDRTLAKADERGAPPAVDKAMRPSERFWLQAGSFAQEADAENLKARLAFAGWEAVIQPASLPDKGLRYRVRLGPYDNTDELTRVKGELAKRGFDAAVIKF